MNRFHIIASMRSQKIFISFAFSSMLLNISTMIASIAILRWVEPNAMGIWQTLLLVQSYSDIVKLGILSGMNRELPYLLGKGDRRRGYETAQTAQLYVLIWSLLGSLGFISILLVPTLGAFEWKTGLLVMSIIWPVGFYSSYLQSTFRAQADFTKLSYIQILDSVLRLTTIVLVWKWGYTGMCIRAVVLTLTITYVLHRIRPIRISPKFKWNTFRLLLGTGLPLFLTSYLYSMATGFDKVILLQYGGIDAVGRYALVGAVLGAMETVPNSLILYLYPKMSFNFGKHSDKGQLRSASLRALVIAFVICFPIGIVGWFSLPFIAEYLFPKYSSATNAAQLALIAGFLFSARSATAVLGSLKAWRYLYLYMGLFIITKWVFPWYFARIYDPLMGIAVGNIISSVIMVCVAIGVSYIATRSNKMIAPNSETIEIAQ